MFALVSWIKGQLFSTEQVVGLSELYQKRYFHHVLPECHCEPVLDGHFPAMWGLYPCQPSCMVKKREKDELWSFIFLYSLYCKPPKTTRQTAFENMSHLLARLVISPANTPALVKGLFRAFCKFFSWFPAFYKPRNKVVNILFIFFYVKSCKISELYLRFITDPFLLFKTTSAYLQCTVTTFCIYTIYKFLALVD